MWVNLSEKDIVRLRAALAVANLTDPEKSAELQERLQLDEEERRNPKNEAWVEKAEELHVFGTDGDREIDSQAVVSLSDDGAYVMMWGWVRNDQMGIEDEDDEDLCRTEEYAQGGDGECPDCADLTDQKENPESYKESLSE